ncbi:hypothetical protein OP492_04555 [Pseudomonas mosselii]|uniref:hypothetical protein n=1 Tax=Pseudomonas mosselii TaxID=78327 RepID=UPI002B05957A|nr:hypothetical protein [Pseudomonas mosselii]MEA3233921.1 hypothetical protein [Pseudomonas mosselii]
MKRLALVVLAGIVLAGCGDSDIDRARKAAAYHLKDPESAQFRNDRVVGKDGTVCGEVNGKNSLGVYVGFSRYVALRKDDGSYMALVDADGQSSIVSSTCD